MAWQLHTAKQKFSELVDRAQYRRLRRHKRNFKDFLLGGPPYFDDLEIERSTEPSSRPLEL